MVKVWISSEMEIHMNATVMPNEFRGKIDECNMLINEANKVMGKPDEFGMICPVTFIDDYDKLQNRLSETIGKMSIYRDVVKNKEPYNVAIDKMTATRDELIARKNESNKRQIENAVTLERIKKNNL